MCDAYVMAPARGFVEVFAAAGVEITMSEAREPMGLPKDLHIRELLGMAGVRGRWRARHGRDPDESDARRLFEQFEPRQVECLPDYATLLPGVVEMAGALQRDQGVKIGVTTGFWRSMVDVLVSHARDQGFVPDCTVAGDEVAYGARPRPFMLFRNLELMDVHPVQSVVKVDDTVVGSGRRLGGGMLVGGDRPVQQLHERRHPGCRRDPGRRRRCGSGLRSPGVCWERRAPIT